MLQLEKYLRPYWWYMLLTVLIKLLGAVMELMIPDLMETILDEKVPRAGIRSAFTCTAVPCCCARRAACFPISLPTG